MNRKDEIELEHIVGKLYDKNISCPDAYASIHKLACRQYKKGYLKYFFFCMKLYLYIFVGYYMLIRFG